MRQGALSTRRRGRLAALTATLVTLAMAGGVVSLPASPAAAQAAGCRVGYEVGSQWPGGFTGNVTVTNLGSPISSWTLTWSFSAGQTVVQAWNASVSQSGNAVTAGNVGWNGNLGTNASTSFGFNGSWNNAANPAPASFSLNGVACTGTTQPPPGPQPPPPGPQPPPPGPQPPPPGPQPPPPGPQPPPPTGWNPPANLVQPLNEVWQHQEETYNNGNLYGFRNYGWDQLFANGGYINYCVRWDSPATVTAAQRDQIHATLSRQFTLWMNQMLDNGQGWNNWPYTQVPVRVVGWAVRDRSQLQWSDNSVDIYVNDIRENAPQCATACGRFFNQNGQYPNCPGGAARHYDMSLWLTSGFGGGHGGDWGQRLGSEYYMNNINAANMTILLHEIGHTFGLDDFYDWTPTGQCCFIMRAGSASQITEFDKWMFRDWWRHLRSRYGY